MTNVAILGCGGIARKMAETINMMKDTGRPISLYAAASRNLQRAQALANEFGAQVAYGSYAEMLADPAVDLVYVATPHSHHAEHMKMCIEAGKAVLCEKAFTGNARQAEEVLALAKERGVLVVEAIWPRFAPAGRILKGLIDEGKIGEPLLLTGNLGYPITMNERIVKPELAGGALLDLSVYTLTFASMLFGDDIERMESSAKMLPTGVDCTDSIVLYYKDGKTAHLMTSSLAATDRRGVIYGTTGYIAIDNVNFPMRAEIWRPNPDRSHSLVETIPMPGRLTGYEYEVEACMEALANGWIEHPAMPHAETLTIMRQMDALRAQWGMVYPFD